MYSVFYNKFCSRLRRGDFRYTTILFKSFPYGIFPTKRDRGQSLSACPVCPNSAPGLSGALSATAQYVGLADSNISTIEANLWENNAVAAGTHIYARIPSSKVTKVDDRTVRYTIFIDEDSCNGLDPLNEIGLFIKNPKASASETSVMAAYRYFSNIVKTSDFGLVFRWVISFG